MLYLSRASARSSREGTEQDYDGYASYSNQIFTNIYLNDFDQDVKNRLPVKHYLRFADDCLLLAPGRQELEALLPKISEAIGMLGMSARGSVRVLRVSRTLADLQERDLVSEEIIAEAVSYRSLERLSNIVHSGGAVRV